MLRGLPCRSAGLMISSGSGSTAASDSVPLLAASGSAERPTRRRLRSWCLHVRKRCHAIIKMVQRTMQGTQKEIRELKENTTWQRFNRDFIYQPANRTKIFPSAPYSNPKLEQTEVTRVLVIVARIQLLQKRIYLAMIKDKLQLGAKYLQKLNMTQRQNFCSIKKIH